MMSKYVLTHQPNLVNLYALGRPYPVAMVYKRHQGGMATPQYIVAPDMWTWS